MRSRTEDKKAGRVPLSREAVLVLVLVAGLVSLPWLLGSGDPVEKAKAAATGTRPNVMIIVLDALRADRLGSIGYEREITPMLDQLARDPDSVIFRHHYVNGAYTKPSTASLFSGLFVFQHGVLYGHEIVEIPDRPGFYPAQRLSEDVDTMAERFDRLGYDTFGIVKSWHLDPKYGFAQGFDNYVGAWFDGDLPRVNKAIEFIEGADGPFFGYLHQAACHHPFPPANRHPEVMKRYGYEAGVTYDERQRIAQGVDFTTAAIAHAVNEGTLDLRPDDVAFLNLVYDAEARSADAIIGKFLWALHESGRYDDTLIIVTADHGEELYDHKGYGHGHALWEEVIHVPLIVKFPRGWKPQTLGREVTATTQAVDLLPTLLEFVDAPGAEPPTEVRGARREQCLGKTPRAPILVETGLRLFSCAHRCSPSLPSFGAPTAPTFSSTSGRGARPLALGVGCLPKPLSFWPNASTSPCVVHASASVTRAPYAIVNVQPRRA